MLILGEFSLFISLFFPVPSLFPLWCLQPCSQIQQSVFHRLTDRVSLFSMILNKNTYLTVFYVCHSTPVFQGFSYQLYCVSICTSGVSLSSRCRQGQHFLCDRITFFNQHINAQACTTFFLFHFVTSKAGVCYVSVNFLLYWRLFNYLYCIFDIFYYMNYSWCHLFNEFDMFCTCKELFQCILSQQLEYRALKGSHCHSVS